MANKVRSLLGGPGFYAVLALCIVAAGVGGYFLLLREDPQAAVPAVPDTEASAPAEDLPEHEPVVETVPLEEPEEESEPAVMPEVTVPLDDTPVVAEEPQVVVSPLQGRWWRPFPWTSCSITRRWTTGGPMTAWTSQRRRGTRSWRPAPGRWPPSATTR